MPVFTDGVDRATRAAYPAQKARRHAIPQRVDASVWVCVMRFLMPALLPKGDESAMNFEAVGVKMHRAGA